MPSGTLVPLVPFWGVSGSVLARCYRASRHDRAAPVAASRLKFSSGLFGRGFSFRSVFSPFTDVLRRFLGFTFRLLISIVLY